MVYKDQAGNFNLIYDETDEEWSIDKKDEENTNLAARSYRQLVDSPY